MKIIALIVTLLAWSAVASAQTSESRYSADTGGEYNVNKTNDIGVGLMLGNVTGPGIKWWHTENGAVNAGVGFNGGNTAIMADYLYHFRNIAGNMTGNENLNTFVPYVGAGLIGAFTNGKNNIFNYDTGNFGLGAEVPVGVEWLPHAAPVGVFAEVKPGLGFVPNTFGFLTADLGGRYYF